MARQWFVHLVQLSLLQRILTERCRWHLSSWEDICALLQNEDDRLHVWITAGVSIHFFNESFLCLRFIALCWQVLVWLISEVFGFHHFCEITISGPQQEVASISKWFFNWMSCCCFASLLFFCVQVTANLFDYSFGY